MSEKQQKPAITPPPPKRRGFVKAVGETVSGLTRPAFGKRGLSDGTIIHNWHLIAGAFLANHTLPEKISFPAGRKAAGTLHLKIENSALAPEVQHLEPILIEKINSYYGYKAVERVRIIHGPLPQKPVEEGRGPPRKLNPTEETQLSHELDEIDDPDLKKALEKLGRSVIGRS